MRMFEFLAEKILMFYESQSLFKFGTRNTNLKYYAENSLNYRLHTNTVCIIS